MGTIRYRLTNTGVLITDGEFDEVTQTTADPIRLTANYGYAALLDEVTVVGAPMRINSPTSAMPGVLQVEDYFDEVTPLVVNLGNFFSGLVTYLSNYTSEFANASFYNYTLDGNATFIGDGGLDMYDSGNYTYPWYASGTPNWSQSAGSNGSPLAYNATGTVDTDFVYKGLGYDNSHRPLSIMAYRTTADRSIGFQKSGNSGADGGGILDSGIIYNGTVINGYTVYAFRRQTYNAGDPSHCDLYMLIGHNNWASVFGTINSYADPVSNGGNGGYFYATNSTNVIAVASLLSKSGGARVTVAEIQTVVQAWINRIQQYLGY